MLAVATAVTTVNVQEVSQMVKTDSPNLGQVLERKRIESLPVNGRGYQGLLATVPGIDATGRIQAYGLRVGTHTLLFDGAPMNEIWEDWVAPGDAPATAARMRLQRTQRGSC